MDRILLTPGYVPSLAAKDLADARRLLARVPSWATAIEYRLDLAAEKIDPRALLALDPRTVIATYRTIREGGNFAGSAEEYRRVVSQAYDAGAVVDVEFSSGLLGDAACLPDRRRVIASLHSLFSLPDDWEERLTAMRATGARVVKLVAGAADLAESLRIGGLQRGRSGGGVVAIFPMGPASAPGRVLSAHLASALVYGSVERETAAGQIPIRDLLEVYDVARPRPPEALFGVVGGSPAKSLSPSLYNALFRARDLPWLYVPLPVSDFEREAPQTIVSDPPIRGMAVTQPWKLAAARAGRPSEDVVRTGAANTLYRDGNRWRAENTDVDGVFDPLADHDTGEGRTAVIVGAGGAARAAIVAARRLGYEVTVTARRDAEADLVAQALSVDSMAWADLAASEADLYLNATPVGWAEGDPPAIPPRVLEARPLVFDCVYRKDGKPTATVRAARSAGCPVIEGLTMLAAQAVRQAQLFGVPDVTLAEVGEILRKAVSR